jgi:excinuclease ABC subunit C
VFERCRRRNRPCLLYDIERCSGPCVDAVSPAEHRAIVLDLCDFLDGNTHPVIDRLEGAMRAASAAEEYEKAAKMRDQLDNVRKAIERQQMVSSERDEMDVVGFVEDELEAAFQVFFVRRGRVTGRKGFVVDKVEDLTPPELVARFLERHYAEAEVPKQVLVPLQPDDAALVGRWMSTLRGAKVTLRVPQRGPKRALLETVTENARDAFQRHRLKRSSDFAARSRQLTELQSALGMKEAPLRIECFDISNTGPDEAVGSMVVFEDALPKRSDYRRFAIKYTPGPDDFAMMEEVVRRRFARYGRENENGEAEKSRRFAYPPNLVVVDGGKGQLGRVIEVIDQLGIQNVFVCGLAKRMEEIFVPDRSDPILIPRSSEALYLLQSVRDEAHRFANTYHQLRRGRRMTSSPLDSVPGLGEIRRKRLLKHFGSLKRIRSATLEELYRVPGIPSAVAETVYERFSQPSVESTST